MKKKIFIILVALLIQTLFITTVNSDNSVAFRQPYPKDIAVLISNPEISMKLILNENKIQEIKMKINDRVVAAQYDVGREMVYYKPVIPLTEGQYNISVEISFIDWDNILSQSWSFNVSKDPIGTYDEISEGQTELVKQLNEFRKSIEAEDLDINKALNAAANAHTNYMVKNNILTHDEYITETGYRGSTYTTRARIYGYNGISVYENIHKIIEPSNLVFEEIISNPYNKILLMNPFLEDVGYFSVEGYSTILVGNTQTENSKLVVYPGNNQIDVNTKWEKKTKEDKVFIPEDNFIGEPIVLSYYVPDNLQNIELVEASLRDKEKEEVKTYINTPGEDEKLHNSIIITPINPLKNESEYSLYFELKANYYDKESENITYASIFTTKVAEKDAIVDVSGHWAEEAIISLYEIGILDIKVDNNFLPEEMITRADLCKYIVNMLEIPLEPVEGNFTDLEEIEEITKYIEAAKRSNIINGYPDRTCLPNNKITRQEIAVIIKRVYENETGKTVLINSYETGLLDEEIIKSWAVESVKVAHKLNIIVGKSDGKFYPLANSTRAETAIIIERIRNLIK